MTSIVDAAHYLFTSESVTEGHPDKMCDQISDAILDAILRDDPQARVACETATTTGTVIVLGEITTRHLRRVPGGRPRDRPGHRLHGRARTASTTAPAARWSRSTSSRPTSSAASTTPRKRAARRSPRPGRRRPGNDVRLRVQRDARAHAAADRARAPARAAARRGAQGRPLPLPPAGRQDPGHRRVPARQAGCGARRSSSRRSTTRRSPTSGCATTSSRCVITAGHPGGAADGRAQ